MSCPITTDPTGAQALYYRDGSAYDATAAASSTFTGNGAGGAALVVQQTLGVQSSPCVSNPEPPRTVNDRAITGGQLP